MKTISERIDAVIAGLLLTEQITSEEQVETILREHLVEQWLDAPDGPGWWWIKWYGLLSTTNIRQDQFECGYWVSGHKWQRAIEPS